MARSIVDAEGSVGTSRSVSCRVRVRRVQLVARYRRLTSMIHLIASRARRCVAHTARRNVGRHSAPGLSKRCAQPSCERAHGRPYGRDCPRALSDVVRGRAPGPAALTRPETHAGLLLGLPFALPLGLMGGLMSGFRAGAASSLLFTELALWLRGRRVRFMPLLESALDRQVLRQAGAVYQFRHADLQDRLAERYEAAHSKAKTRGG
jgi:hypothetical protein